MSVENTHFGAVKIKTMLADAKSIFFIGIGGVSMSGLAEMTFRQGKKVGGSDRTKTAVTSRLEKIGISVFSEHHAENLNGFDAVVYSVAISDDNPEYRKAKRTGLPLISRADYLGYLMTAYEDRIGIAGMHGKSTCTAMCAEIFLQNGDATVLCGAELPLCDGKTLHIGVDRKEILFEACEYMDSFLDFSPTLPVILNVGLDHVDYFHSMEQIRSSFLRFAEKSDRVLCNADDPETTLALSSYSGKKMTFGIETESDYMAKSIRFQKGISSFDLYRGSECLGTIPLHVFGQHNVYNALAAAAAADLSGIGFETIRNALSHFSGAKRRMEFKGEINGAAVYDDYGHHPDEIRATLQGAKQMGYKRVLCAFQPHTFSRTAGLLDAFSTAFENADRVFLADIYAAREQNVFGVTSETLAGLIGQKAVYCGSFESVAKQIQKEMRPDDLVIVMGAGDIYKTFDYLFNPSF